MVVGAGITGMATAVAAAEAGCSVLVLEDRFVGAGATTLSTAKVTLLHGLKYSSLTDRHGADVAARYAAAQQTGLSWLRERVPEAMAPATALTYATDASTLRDVRAEVDAARAAGIDARFVDDVDLPFATTGAVAVDDQGRADPAALLGGLRSRLLAAGGRVVERVRARGVRDLRHGATVRTDAGDVEAGWALVATGMPFVDRSLLFARAEPKSSYVIGVRAGGPLPEGMYLSAGDPVRSLRTAPDPERPGARVLVVGGAGHKTGEFRTTEEHYDELARWASEHFAVEDVPWRWSTEDFVPDDGLPFVGPAWPFPTRTLVATGYAKWGFTNGAAAALVLAARVAGTEPPVWADDWTPRRFEGRQGAREFAKANADVARKLVGGWLGLAVRGRAHRPTVSAEVDGVRHEVSAVCTHLGGIVRWNDADRCWDCPLHGSKFAADGQLLHAPAVRDLERKGPASSGA